MPSSDERYWWAFKGPTMYHNLKIGAEFPEGFQLIGAYYKHPKRMKDGEPVLFALFNKHSQMVRTVTLKELEDYEAEMREIREDAAERDAINPPKP